jgi:hypothetical protein
VQEELPWHVSTRRYREGHPVEAPSFWSWFDAVDSSVRVNRDEMRGMVGKLVGLKPRVSASR